MEYPSYLKEAIEKAKKEKTVKDVQGALVTVVDEDRNREVPQATEIAEAVQKELEGIGIELFEKDNGHLALPPEEEWTIDTWHTIKAALTVDNFSFEKFPLAEMVLMKLRERGVKEAMPEQPEPAPEPPQPPKPGPSTDGGTRPKPRPKPPRPRPRPTPKPPVDIVDGVILVAGVIVGVILIGHGITGGLFGAAAAAAIIAARKTLPKI